MVRSLLTLGALSGAIFLSGVVTPAAYAQGADQETIMRLRDEGVALSAKGKLLEARAKFKEALELDDGHADTWFHYGQTFQRRGELDDAIKHYSKAIFLLSGHHKAFHNRGVAYWYQGKLEDALADVDEAVRLKPKYYEAWNTRASLLTNLGRAKEAMEDAGTAIELVERNNDKREKPRYYVAAYHTRAVAAIRIGELKQAKSDLLLATEKSPENAAYRFRLAVTQFRLGEQKDAVASYDASLAITKDSVTASGRRPRPLSDYLRARCIAGRGQAKFFLGDVKGALADLEASKKWTPDHAYTPLWIHGLGGKATSLERLSKHAYEKDGDKWIQKILLHYTGAITEAKLLEIAERPEDDESKSQRRLQAHCYIALLAERGKDMAKAKAHYEKVVAEKVLGYTEHWWAKLRLEQLK